PSSANNQSEGVCSKCRYTDCPVFVYRVDGARAPHALTGADMRSVLRAAVLGVLLGTFCVPVPARAAVFINPWGGLVFGSDQATTGFHTFGFTFGDAGHGLVGTETTVGFTPGIFGTETGNYVLDLMAGFTIGKTFKSKTRHDTRPYGLIEG